MSERDDELHEEAGFDGVMKLIEQATDQLVLMGNHEMRATVRFAIDDQWFSCSLQMIDEPAPKAKAAS